MRLHHWLHGAGHLANPSLLCIPAAGALNVRKRCNLKQAGTSTVSRCQQHVKYFAMPATGAGQGRKGQLAWCQRPLGTAMLFGVPGRTRSNVFSILAAGCTVPGILSAADRPTCLRQGGQLHEPVSAQASTARPICLLHCFCLRQTALQGDNSMQPSASSHAKQFAAPAAKPCCSSGKEQDW